METNEQQPRSDKEYTLNHLVPLLSSVQEGLLKVGVSSLIGGGVGLDLLGTKYVSNFTPRPHKDVDLYIPNSQKRRMGRGLKKVSRLDFFPFWWLFSRHFINTTFEGIPLDIFFIQEEKPDRFVVAELSLMQELTSGTESGRVSPVDVSPEKVEYQGKTLYVLKPSSMQSIKNIVGGMYGRDGQILGEIMKIIHLGQQ